jgi:hypothetical protein
MQTHPYTDVDTVRPVVRGELSLRNDGGPERRVRAREGEEERIALRVDLAASPLLCRGPDDALMLREGPGVTPAQPL